jgi:hypothetical protein
LLTRVLRLEAPAASEVPPKASRTAKQYREAKRKQKEAQEAPLMTSGALSPDGFATGALSPVYLSMSDSARRGKRSRGLLNQVIMEEADSEDY